MPISDELRKANQDLWERMVSHPFVRELGDGSLPLEKFKRYFLQDYLFLGALAKVLGQAVSKAPSLEAAQPLSPFLHTILNAEEDLFFRAFHELGVPPAEYRSAEPLPTGEAMANFLVATAYDGSFQDIATALLVTEWTYFDWATRLAQAEARPRHRMYQEWIEIHAAAELGAFVEAMKRIVDAIPARDQPQAKRVFRTALRYEVLFWEMAYHGEQWPQAGL
ncbi:MAG: TenA family protein [Chloroflexi bacterium]|nr:TenA family protein [Chloroflexota bacterium]